MFADVVFMGSGLALRAPWNDSGLSRRVPYPSNAGVSDPLPRASLATSPFHGEVKEAYATSSGPTQVSPVQPFSS